MELKDITNDYIKVNFDIDANRKEKQFKETIGDIEPLDGSYTFDDFIEKIRNEFNAITENYERIRGNSKQQKLSSINYKMKCNMVIEDEPHPFYSGDSGTAIEVVAEVSRKETDKEVISRLKGRERQKIKKQQERERKKAQDEQRLKSMAKELGYEVNKK